MIVRPCLDCPDRNLGCHSTCQKYVEYRDQLKNYKKKKQNMYYTYVKEKQHRRSAEYGYKIKKAYYNW